MSFKSRTSAIRKRDGTINWAIMVVITAAYLVVGFFVSLGCHGAEYGGLPSKTGLSEATPGLMVMWPAVVVDLAMEIPGSMSAGLDAIKS